MNLEDQRTRDAIVTVPKLTIELVPQGQWGANLRKVLPKSDWDKLRKRQYILANYCCEICGGRGPKWPVECHEVWEYDDQNKIQTLTGLVALCPPCHRVKHMGRSMAVGEGEEAVSHFMDVNDCSRNVADAYVEEAFMPWQDRSGYEWDLELSWLKDNGILIPTKPLERP